MPARGWEGGFEDQTRSGVEDAHKMWKRLLRSKMLVRVRTFWHMHALPIALFVLAAVGTSLQVMVLPSARTGIYRDNKMIQGTYAMHDVRSWEGQQGTHDMQDGSRREGQWKEGQMLGEGRDAFKDDRPSKGWGGIMGMLGLTKPVPASMPTAGEDESLLELDQINLWECKSSHMKKLRVRIFDLEEQVSTEYNSTTIMRIRSYSMQLRF
jgi:hypothetical protein